MIQNDQLEAVINDIKSQMDLEKKTADIIAEKADALVKSNLDQIEVLHKSISSLTEKVQELTNKIDALNVPKLEEIEKSVQSKLEQTTLAFDAKVEEISKSTNAKVEDLQKTVDIIADEPVRKSVVSIEEPVVEKTIEREETIGDLFEQLHAELKKSTTTHRMNELRSAIIKLESGCSPQQIKQIINKK